MMPSKRRATVHDFSSLLLHPDGTRIKQSDANTRSKGKNKYAVKDHRGNWIALDAGGVGRVKTRYTAKEVDSERDEGEDDEAPIAGPSTPRIDKGKAIAVDEEDQGEEPELRRAATLKDTRAKWRKLYYEDVAVHGPAVTIVPASVEVVSAATGPQSNSQVDKPAGLSQLTPTSVCHRADSHLRVAYTSQGPPEMYSLFCEHILQRTRAVA